MALGALTMAQKPNPPILPEYASTRQVTAEELPKVLERLNPKHHCVGMGRTYDEAADHYINHCTEASASAEECGNPEGNDTLECIAQAGNDAMDEFQMTRFHAVEVKEPPKVYLIPAKLPKLL